GSDRDRDGTRLHQPRGSGVGSLPPPLAETDRRGDQPPLSGIGMLKILGYPDRYSVAPGEEIAFKLSLEEGTRVDARLVRVIHGDAKRAGPGLKFRHIPTAIDGSHPGKRQEIDAGSYMIAEKAPAIAAKPFTFFAMIWPTLPERRSQTLITQWDARTL